MFPKVLAESVPAEAARLLITIIRYCLSLLTGKDDLTHATERLRSEWSASAVEQHWNLRARAFDCVHPRLKLIANLINDLPGSNKTLLDVGCGPAALKRAIPSNIEYFGVGIVSEIINEHHDPDHFALCDLNHDPKCFGNMKFDIVVCSGIIEYIHDPERFMHFLCSKMSDHGHLIISYENRQHYRCLPSWLRGELPRYTDPHFNFMTIPQMKRLLARNDFQIRKQETLTKGLKNYSLLKHFTSFPSNMLSRQFVFVCMYVGASLIMDASVVL
jgi:SAM-dependent methyltransferase